MKKVIIIGAGPAGLTAGYELLRKSSDYDVTIVEEASNVGGLCANNVHNDKVLDAGGHMFISNNSQVKDFWNQILPTQGVPSCDDLFLDRYCKISNGGPNPGASDNVMLSREKITRVYNGGKFYESPFRLNKDNIKSFGVGNSIKSGFSQLGGTMFKKKEKSLKEYYVNRFGSELYDMFLDDYTEKVLGRNPGKISAAFGQVSERDLITPNISVDKNDGKDLEKATPPFANRFYYPKKGVAQMWENVADRFIERGGSIHKNCKVLKIHSEDGVISGITCVADGESFFVACDILISSMPVKDFIGGLDKTVPFNVSEVVHGLSYRGLVTIGVELLDMGIKNDTDIKTINNIIPDSFVYVNEKDIKLGRILVFNNYSPYMVGKDSHIWLGLNYYCNEGDYYWSLNEQSWKDLAVSDLKKLGIIRESGDILDYKKVSYGKAFPGYFDSFERFDEVRNYLDSFDNLYCIGRNGQHNFMSMEQAMLTSFETVKCILTRSKDKSTVWNAADVVEKNEDGKVNSALLAQDVEYRGNAVPLQRMDTLQNDAPREPQKEPISIKRMRRPMMTPIKKAEPVLDANGQVVEGAVVFNDYNLIGAPSFRRAPVTVEEVTVEEETSFEQNESTEVESNVTTNVQDVESVTTTEDIKRMIEEKENEVASEKVDDRVILKNSVIIAQRPERTIPIEVPEEENTAQSFDNTMNFPEESNFVQPVANQTFDEVKPIYVEEEFKSNVTGKDVSEIKPIYVEETPVSNISEIEPIYVETEATAFANEKADNRTDTEEAFSKAVEEASFAIEKKKKLSTVTTSNFELKDNNPYAYIWNQSASRVQNDYASDNLSSEVPEAEASEQSKPSAIINNPLEEIISTSEEENSDIVSESEGLYTTPNSDKASFDYYMEHMFDDLPDTGMKSSRYGSQKPLKIVKEPTVKKAQTATITINPVIEKEPESSYRERDVQIIHNSNLLYEESAAKDAFSDSNNFDKPEEQFDAYSNNTFEEPVANEAYSNNVSYEEPVLEDNSLSNDYTDEIKPSYENEIATELETPVVSNSFEDSYQMDNKKEESAQTQNVFSFGKVERFEEKESNIENMRVIEKSRNYDDDSNLNIFGRVETFEKKEMLEDTERVVMSQYYSDMSNVSDDIFNKADHFEENVLLTETENVIPRPVYKETSSSNDSAKNTMQNNYMENDVEKPAQKAPSDKNIGASLFSPYSSEKTEIDPAVVFKNAKVIKSTKVVKTEIEEVKEPERKSWLSNLAEIGGKEKVIAKYVNGEKVPVKEVAPKKTKPKKAKQTVDETEIVQPPISVVWENAETENNVETQALPTPKKRGRKSKATKENNLKTE